MPDVPPVAAHLPAPGAVLAWAEPIADQFAFWCGEWRGETVAGGSGGVGQNVVTWLWDRAALHEEFSITAADGGFHGRSVSVPVPGRGWCQTWVDSDGQYLDFVGGLVGDEMLLDRIADRPDGRRVQQRMRWWDVGQETFSWDWLVADVGTDEWTLSWRLRYTRA